ncbi:hypothetical protein FXO38_19395 [Capsicum annuum]|nr:hypothetical protein FXO38_19395 [Capsicum annuum]
MARGNKCKAAEDKLEEIDPLEARINKEALILPHCAKDLPEHMKFNGQLFHYTLLDRVEPDNKLHEMWFNINDRPACFGLKEFALVTSLNCGFYPRDSRYVKGMEADYLKKRIDFSRQKKTFETKGVSSYALFGFPWEFMHVTRGLGKSKPRASGKTLMIENLEERVFRLEESIKDITDFVKEVRMRREEKERQKKRDETKGVQVQSRHSAARADRDDSGIKEALLRRKIWTKVMKRKKKKKNATVVCEEENKADGAVGVEKEDHDEGRQDKDDKNEKSGCEE